MKLRKVQQSQNEILYKKRPCRLESKCLLRALDAHENMLLTSLGQAFKIIVSLKHGLS